MTTQEVIPVICPKCQTRYNAPIISIINVDQDPNLKSAFLQGRLNIGQCPQCGFASPLQAPLLYHDGQKELALVLVPTNLQLTHIDEQKIIGDLSNRLMNSLPPEKRKAYLLTPKTFLTMDSLAKAILAADGVTEEMLQEQEAKLKLIDQFLQAKDEAALKELVAAHDAELDYKFFEILTAMAMQTLQENDQVRGQNLLAFRQIVASLSSKGQELVAQIDDKIGLQSLSPEKLLQDLKSAANDDEFVSLVAAGRQLIDYTFFQTLTGQIDAAEAASDAETAEALKSLRSRILDASAKIDAATRQAMDRASALLTKLLEAADPKKIILDNLNQFDETFIALLGAQVQKATQDGKKDIAERLTNLYHLITQTIQEQMPPEMLLLNQLLEAGSPEAINDILKQNKAMLTPNFTHFLEHIQADLENQGQVELAALVAEIKGQAEVMI